VYWCKSYDLQTTEHFVTWVDSGIFGKKRVNARGFAQEYLPFCTGNGPGRNVKRRGKSSGLHFKKIFLLGRCGFFVSDVISGGLLGHLGLLRLALGTNR